MMESISEVVKQAIKDHNGLLIAVLGEIQEKCNYLPEQAIREVASELELPLRDVYGVATFYQSFSLVPKGKHVITACIGTACHVRGGARMAELISKELGIKPGETTPDKQFTFETVNCLGACALGPVVVIDKEYYGNMTASKLESILKKYKK